MTVDAFDRYLRILGCPAREPGREALAELVAAQLTRVPFENISKLYFLGREGLRRLPGLERYLDGVEQFNFGGTCYANNYYFYRLLDHLGYDVKLCGADMSAPDVHVVSLVSIEGLEYIVDAGYAAPFFSPLPRDLEHEHVVELGHDRYILKPQNEDGSSKLEMYRDGELKHSYRVKPVPRSIEHFEAVIADSYRPEATFMNAVLIVRCEPNRMWRLHNLTLSELHGRSQRSRRLADRGELARVAEERFGIDAGIVAEVTDGIGELGDAWT
jgi:arylamine N-acetyltransferase